MHFAAVTKIFTSDGHLECHFGFWSNSNTQSLVQACFDYLFVSSYSHNLSILTDYNWPCIIIEPRREKTGFLHM